VDEGNQARENFSSEYDGAFYAEMYKRDGLSGGHIILLNPASSEYYEATRAQAFAALKAYPGGMQIGGGITPENAAEYLDAQASHVIVTSYVFRDGQIHWDRLEKLVSAVGREHLVLDLSCRGREDGAYYVVTDRWQKFTDVKLSVEVMDKLGAYCDEFLVHGVDVEGKSAGPAEGLVEMLAEYRGRPVTYAGGIGSEEDLDRFRRLSGGRIDFTIGSALDLFGGKIPYETVRNYRGTNREQMDGRNHGRMDGKD
jgi:phosphoribosylformimino-5-aminoimidazole carboxamide ribotide isomerase